jgi:hypothetical protein
MGRLRTRTLLLMGVIGTFLGFVLYVVAKVSVTPRRAVTKSALPPAGPLAHTVTSIRPRRGPPATATTRVRPRTLLLLGATCVILGVALFVSTRMQESPGNIADPLDTSAVPGAVTPTTPDATSSATGATETTSSAPPPVTLTTIAAGALPGRLKQTAATVGFTVLGLKAPGWELTAVDTQAQAGESFAAVSYVRGYDYVTITQEKTATPATLPGAEPTTIRGQPGTLALMNPVVLLRWQEQGVAMMLTTNLARDAALSLAERLEPVP